MLASPCATANTHFDGGQTSGVAPYNRMHRPIRDRSDREHYPLDELIPSKSCPLRGLVVFNEAHCGSKPLGVQGPLLPS